MQVSMRFEFCIKKRTKEDIGKISNKVLLSDRSHAYIFIVWFYRGKVIF